MAPAANRLRLVVDKARFGEPKFPVIANATAEAVTTAARARRLLVDQLTAPVRWIECVEHAARIAGEDTQFIEIGSGSVLAGLLKRIIPEARVVSVGTADALAQFLEAA
jgi:[acyl-carrier-protein] S-malonyltransferase